MNIIAIIGGFGLLTFLIVYAFRRDHKLQSEGKIVTRKRNFVEEATEFILLADSSSVAEELQKLPYPDMKLSMNARSDGKSFDFFCPRWNWKARLFLKDTEGDKAVYCFEFLEWKVNGSMTIGDVYMNMLLTGVEKMFLSLDPHTQVQTRLIGTKIKSF